MTRGAAATLAVDAGTTLIKAVVLAVDGEELAVAQRPTAVLRPGGARSEQDMLEVRSAVLDCVRRAVASSPAPIGRVAITAQGDGAWCVDAAGEPTGAAVLWNDGRATDIVERWTTDGTLERAFRINGSLGNLGLPHAILAWSAEHDPHALERVASVLTCGSWLHLVLTGVQGLHPSEASAPWLDIATGTVSGALLDLYGLGRLRDLVPRVLGEDELTAPLLPGIAAETGLPAGTPVTLAPYDVVATAAGSGAVTAGAAFCILGTTLCTGVLLTGPDTGGVPSGLTLLTAPGAPVVRAFPTLAGTGVVDWVTGLLDLDAPAALTTLALESAPGANGVRMWPYLSPAGERAPFLDAGARGLIGGLDFGAGRADLARATIEGLAHVIRDCLRAAGTTPDLLALAGGGSASDLWCRTIADVTGVPTARSAGTQVGATGAMLAALVAGGIAPDTATAAEGLRGERTVFEPDPALSGLFADRHADFLATREAIAPRWAAWSGVRS